MAKEFLVLSSQPLHDGAEQYHILAFYPLVPPITINNIVLVPTPSTLLPAPVDEYNMATDNQKGQLDNGNYMFEERLVVREKGVTGAQMVERLKALWTARNAKVVANLRRKYQISGMWVNV